MAAGRYQCPAFECRQSFATHQKFTDHLKRHPIMGDLVIGCDIINSKCTRDGIDRLRSLIRFKIKGSLIVRRSNIPEFRCNIDGVEYNAWICLFGFAPNSLRKKTTPAGRIIIELQGDVGREFAEFILGSGILERRGGDGNVAYVKMHADMFRNDYRLRLWILKKSVTDADGVCYSIHQCGMSFMRDFLCQNQ
jgi:hypothetical protein